MVVGIPRKSVSANAPNCSIALGRNRAERRDSRSKPQALLHAHRYERPGTPIDGEGRVENRTDIRGNPRRYRTAALTRGAIPRARTRGLSLRFSRLRKSGGGEATGISRRRTQRPRIHGRAKQSGVAGRRRAAAIDSEIPGNRTHRSVRAVTQSGPRCESDHRRWRANRGGLDGRDLRHPLPLRHLLSDPAALSRASARIPSASTFDTPAQSATLEPRSHRVQPRHAASPQPTPERDGIGACFGSSGSPAVDASGGRRRPAARRVSVALPPALRSDPMPPPL